MTLCLIGSVPVDGRETVGKSRRTASKSLMWLGYQVSDRVYEVVFTHVDHQTEVLQEISTDDCIGNVGNDRNPAEGASKAEVQGEGSSTIGTDGGTIDGLKSEGVGGGSVHRGGWNYAYLGARVDEKLKAKIAVCDIK